MYAEGVGAAWGAWWAAGHNDHHIALLAPAYVEQGRLDLADHIVGVPHGRDDERLGTGPDPEVSRVTQVSPGVHPPESCAASQGRECDNGAPRGTADSHPRPSARTDGGGRPQDPHDRGNLFIAYANRLPRSWKYRRWGM